MKKIVAVLLSCLMLFSFSAYFVYATEPNRIDNYDADIDAPDEVNPRYNNNTHRQIIEQANIIAQNNGDAHIPDTYLELVIRVCLECDSIRNTTFGQNHPTGCPHGEGNYYASLKYLWAFAHKVAHIDTNDLDNEVFAASVESKQGIPSLITSSSGFGNLCKLSRHLVKEHCVPTLQNELTHNKNKRCKYAVYGIISHLMGDLFAHRTIVPASVYDYIDHVVNTYDNNKHFLASDFTNFELNYLMKSRILSGPNIDVNNEYTEVAVGYSEIKKYYSSTDDDENVDSTITNMLNSNYIDKRTFDLRRYNKAKYCLAEFFGIYANGYDSSFIKNNGISLRQMHKYAYIMGETIPPIS